MIKWWGGILALVLLGLWLLTCAASAESANLVQNGSFEEGFVQGVGKGWTGFQNGGDIVYGFQSDDWDRAVFDGEYSQLIKLDTGGVGGSQPDRYAGIYQVVDVVPNARYMFSFYGLVRSTEGTEKQSGYNYRVQVGYDFNGGTDPWAVTNWVEMDRWREHPMDKPGRFDSYAHGVTTTSDKLTIFIRVWKKFPTAHETAMVNLDAISLLGPAPARKATSATPQPQEPSSPPTLPQTGGGSPWLFAGLALGLIGVGLHMLRVLRFHA
ncbi:MAG: hypothetical protein H5T69_11540 [Chloroflexi bacterium]|nr:hypothetical protein [Chloroflexota bacterium]